MRRVPRAPLVALLCALAIPALAQPVLHEYVPNLAAGEGSSFVSSHDDAAPSAILHDGELLTAPPLDARAPDEAPLRATPGDGGLREEAGRRSPSFRPDRITALETGVDYFEVFSPALRPYKRMSALDRVELAPDRTPVLLARDVPRTREPVELPGALPPDARPRDRFWGSVVIDFRTGREVPFPTVSPESRLLGVETAPEVPLHFERDGSDNLYAVLDAPDGTEVGEVRVVFLTDAPRTYFGVEAGASLPHGRADALAAEVPALPEAVASDAARVLATLGVRRDQPFDAVLERLVEYFRSFEESSEPPPDTGHIYLDLVRGRRGVCRHRAYAFVITAQQLGIPARFVQNEAHAWVEVHLPENRGWLRVDLGGSAQGVRTHGPGHDAPPYRPNVSDPLPQPPAYRAALEAAARASLLGSERAGASEGAAEASSEGWTEVGELASSETAADVPAPAGPTPAGRAALTLSTDQDLFEVRRGLTIEVSGLATSLGAPVPGLRVEVALFDPERARERLLGVAVTDEAGVYRATVGIPPETPAGHYHLDIRSPGDAHVGPASVR